MSIWLFVSHFHILLAFDGRGVLVLLPKLYFFNTLLVVSVFFVIFIVISNSLYTLKEVKSFQYFIYVSNI